MLTLMTSSLEVSTYLICQRVVAGVYSSLMSLAPIALPITLSMTNDTFRAVMPLPHLTSALVTLSLTFTLDTENRGLEIDWETRPTVGDDLRQEVQQAVEEGRGELKLIKAVQRIERALSSSIGSTTES